MQDEISVLEHFLKMPLNNAESVLDEFRKLDGAKYYPSSSPIDKDSFVYVPGTRKDRVLLVAHADTFFDYPEALGSIVIEEGTYFSGSKGLGIGADDRAGCAILWLLRDMGHSLLVTNSEEYGSLAAMRIAARLPQLYDELNGHCYILFALDKAIIPAYRAVSGEYTLQVRKLPLACKLNQSQACKAENLGLQSVMV